MRKNTGSAVVSNVVNTLPLDSFDQSNRAIVQLLTGQPKDAYFYKRQNRNAEQDR